jgi:hypothetical protein
MRQTLSEGIPLPQTRHREGDGSQRSATSWSAVLGGAAAALAITVILVVLGTGVGLSAVSPWYGAGASAATVGVGAVIWLVLTQWVSSLMGGYLAGRLRAKWVQIHDDEVFFRDTAHGFLAWAVATILGAALFAATTASGVSGAAKGATQVATSAAGSAAQSGIQPAGGQTADGNSGYFLDSLFRAGTPPDGSKPNVTEEAGRILAKSTSEGQVTLSPDDKTYLARLVAARAGLSPADAEQRVDNTVKQVNDAANRAREAADKARKRAAQLAVVVALSMVLGAFIAGVAGGIGGRTRDKHELGDA